MASSHKNHLSDKFIILKALKYGESDLILHALSKQGSKRAFIAKGARNSRKRFGGGVLEPTHFVEFTYKEGSGASEFGPMGFLQEAKLLNGFVGLRSDYERLQMGLYFVHLTEKVSMEGLDECEYAFNLLGNALKQLETSKHLPHLKAQFELKFLHQQGVLPPEVSQKEFIGRPLEKHHELNTIFPDELGGPFQKLKAQLNHFIHSYVG